jgi:hypothetical protein
MTHYLNSRRTGTDDVNGWLALARPNIFGRGQRWTTAAPRIGVLCIAVAPCKKASAAHDPALDYYRYSLARVVHDQPWLLPTSRPVQFLVKPWPKSMV